MNILLYASLGVAALGLFLVAINRRGEMPRRLFKWGGVTSLGVFLIRLWLNR